MGKIRFSNEWMEKVENWANDHAAMIERYDALLRYRKMQDLAEYLTEWEMDQFYHCECMPIDPSEEEPGDDIDSEDWPE